MKLRRTQKFSKGLKKLTKKHPSLPDDLEKLERILEKLPCGTGGKHWNRLHVSPDGLIMLFKVRLACVSLRGQSLFRIIYACRLNAGNVHCIDLIEIYYKGDKENEDRELIKTYLNDCEILL